MNRRRVGLTECPTLDHNPPPINLNSTELNGAETDRFP